jgi:uncharacterized membrane protein YdjX (TVP38/TMEM64 family)
MQKCVATTGICSRISRSDREGHKGLMKTRLDSASSDEKSLWSLSRIATISLYIAVAGIIAVGVFVLGEDILQHFQSIEAWIKDSGPWALVIFVLLYAILGIFFVPDTVLGIAAGTMFGFTHGLFAAILGSLLGAAIQYALSRRLLRPTVERFISSKPALAALQVAVLKQEFRLQFLIRLTPLNRTLTNYMLGAAGVGFTRFIAACAGFLPILCLEVYFGYAGQQMVGETSQPGHAAVLHDVMLLAGLVVAIIVMVIISRMARRAIEEVAVAAPDTAG